MALGLFSTLIIGTIIGQIGTLVGNEIGTYLIAISSVAKTVTGAGIGVGVAANFKTGTACNSFCSGSRYDRSVSDTWGWKVLHWEKQESLSGAFVAALIGIECGRLAAGRTKIDIILTPLVSICTGAAAGFPRGIANFQFYEMAWKSGKY